jgi:anti-anti-sigma factor
MKLTIVSIERDGIVRVASDGSITAPDFAGGRNPFESLLGQNWAGTRILLNVEKSDYIDSSAVGWLISSQKTVRAAGGGLVLVNVNPGVKQILDLLKVGRVVPIVGTEDEGRKLLLQDAKPQAAEGGVR